MFRRWQFLPSQPVKHIARADFFDFNFVQALERVKITRGLRQVFSIIFNRASFCPAFDLAREDASPPRDPR